MPLCPRSTTRQCCSYLFAPLFLVVVSQTFIACDSIESASDHAGAATTAVGPPVVSGFIRAYPSSTLPPIAPPFLFYWDFGDGPTWSGAVANAQGVNSEATYREQLALGKLPVAWLFGPQWRYGQSYRQFVEYYETHIQSRRAYLIDEWQSPKLQPLGHPLSFRDPYGIRGAIDGIAAAKQNSPDSIIIVAWRGEDSLLPLIQNNAVDYVAIEAYTHMPARLPQSWSIGIPGVVQRLRKLRAWEAVDKALVWLGHIVPASDYPPGKELNAEDLERQLAHYLSVAPELAGVAFYGSANDPLVEIADRLCHEYFLENAPRVELRVRRGAANGDQQSIELVAVVESDPGIVRFRWFVDNRLVHEGPSSSIIYLFANDETGNHLVTVHATDAEHRTGFTQIEVAVR